MTPWRWVSSTGMMSRLRILIKIVGEVGAGKGAIGAGGLVEHGDVRLDIAVMHKPAEHFGGAIARAGNQFGGHSPRSSCARSIIRFAAMTSARRTTAAAGSRGRGRGAR